MKVLLLSHNHTVQEMVALAFRDHTDTQLERCDDVEAIAGDHYDVMMVDDAFQDYRETLDLAAPLGVKHTVLLARMGAKANIGFGHQIPKPFLPSEIETFIQTLTQQATIPVDVALTREPDIPEISARKREKKRKKTSSKKKKKQYTDRTEVLRLDEIETIKSLLENEGLEIVNEEELAQRVLLDERADDDTDPRHQQLYHALRTLKPKKIRKLLKGATVRIDITFPKG